MVVDQLQQWNQTGWTLKLQMEHPNWVQMRLKVGSNKTDAHCIWTSHNITYILEIDKAYMTILCELVITMADIMASLLLHQLALLCQVEMESLTIKGPSMGWEWKPFLMWLDVSRKLFLYLILSQQNIPNLESWPQHIKVIQVSLMIILIKWLKSLAVLTMPALIVVNIINLIQSKQTILPIQ